MHKGFLRSFSLLRSALTGLSIPGPDSLIPPFALLKMGSMPFSFHGWFSVPQFLLGTF